MFYSEATLRSYLAPSRDVCAHRLQHYTLSMQKTSRHRIRHCLALPARTAMTKIVREGEAMITCMHGSACPVCVQAQHHLAAPRLRIISVIESSLAHNVLVLKRMHA
jgi:hypothetical protein